MCKYRGATARLRCISLLLTWACCAQPTRYFSGPAFFAGEALELSSAQMEGHLQMRASAHCWHPCGLMQDAEDAAWHAVATEQV